MNAERGVRTGTKTCAMSGDEAGVFGQSSDEEENQNAMNRGENAMQTLRELQKRPKSPLKDDVQIGDTDDAAALGDDDEVEMARLRHAPKYLEFEKEYGRHEEEGTVLKKRKTEDEEKTVTESVSPAVKIDVADKRTPSDASHKKPRRGDAPLSAAPRKKLDPKIIDDSSDSDDSDDSDEEDLGPQLPVANGVIADNLPLQEDVTFGTPHGGYVSSISIDAAGTRMVSSSNDGSIQFWDFNTMDSRLNCFKSVEALNGGVVRGATFSSTGGKLLCWGALPNARVLDRDGRPLAQTATGDMYIVDAARSKGHSGPVRCAQWFSASSGAVQIATVGNEGTVRLWDVDAAETKPMEDIPIMPQVSVFKLRNARGSKALADTFTCISDGDRPLIAVGCNDQCVKLVDPRMFSLRPAQEFEGVIARGCEFTDICEAPKSCASPALLVRSSDDALRVLDRRKLDKPVAEFLDLPNTISDTSACFVSPDGEYFGTGTSASRRGGTKPGKIVVFSGKTLSPIWQKEVEPDAGSVVCVYWHKKLNQMFFGCGDGSVRALYNASISTGGVMNCVIRDQSAPSKNSLWSKT